MSGPIVLTACDFDDVEHVRRILDALRDARSWTCDQRSQLPCLRFVGADGVGRIVAMEGAVIDAEEPKTKRDGHPRVADALRDAAIVCLRHALQPVADDLVQEARTRRKAYALVVAAQIDCGTASDSFQLTASTPWRNASYATFHCPHGVPAPTVPKDAPEAELCPIMFSVGEGDCGDMRGLSIGLRTSHQMCDGRIDVLESLRAGALLRQPWRNA